MRYQSSLAHKQQGAVLIVALVFLVILTIAGVTAMRFATIEERMAGNIQFRNQAFQIAQSELRGQLRLFNLDQLQPLLIALDKEDVAAGSDILKILPDGTNEVTNLAPVMPLAAGEQRVKSSTLRQVGEKGLCRDGTSSKYECIDFEVAAIATFGDDCPAASNFKCKPNSSQAMGFVRPVYK